MIWQAILLSNHHKNKNKSISFQVAGGKLGDHSQKARIFIWFINAMIPQTLNAVFDQFFLSGELPGYDLALI